MSPLWDQQRPVFNPWRDVLETAGFIDRLVKKRDVASEVLRQRDEIIHASGSVMGVDGETADAGALAGVSERPCGKRRI